MSERDALSDAQRREPSSQEQALLDYAERIQRHCQGRIAVHIHLLRLQSHNRRDHHIRVAIGVFDDLLKLYEGALFHLMNQDIVCVCKDAKIEDLDATVVRLRYLFSEDQVTRFADDHTGAGFCTWYMLDSDYKLFLNMARRYHQLSESHRADAQRLREQISRRARPTREPLNPGLLAKVEDVLANADLSAMIRTQPICAITRQDPPEPVLEEMFVSIGALEETLTPDVSLTADPWLFQHLTAFLDRRMLSQVLREHYNTTRAFSLNLNVGTVLSPEFLKFDQGIAMGVRGRLVIELQKVDIFNDMGAYMFARDFLRERGYRICLDGLTYLTLPFIDRERLGLDFLKLYWSAELFGGVRQAMLDDLQDQVHAAGQARMIICRCDSQDAIRLGQDLGISLFQGRHIDQLLAKHRATLPKAGAARARS